MTTVNCRRTIGISVEHFDLRVDLHRFIESMSKRADVIVFTDKPFTQEIKGLKEVRLYRRRRSFLASMVERLFLLTRRLPKSRNNFFITELFGLTLLSPARQRRGLFYLRLRHLIPGGISVDSVLPWLSGGDATEIGDIDAFLHITRIGALPFLARALASGKPNVAYIYSWDHPCKHTTIPRKGLQAYFTWNRALSEDMVNLQGVRSELMHEVGTTQLATLKQYLETPTARVRRIPYDYIYFGCGPGQDYLSRQEVIVIQRLAVVLRSIAPDLKLIVRPHPNHNNWSCYEQLRGESNVEMDLYRQEDLGRQLNVEQIFDKFNKVEHSRVFIHLGTTLGWEACYFEKPVLFLAQDDLDLSTHGDKLIDLRRFTHQYHNDRYLILDGYPNVIRRSADLQPTLRAALEAPMDFLAYNNAIAKEIPLRSTDEIAASIWDYIATRRQGH